MSRSAVRANTIRGCKIEDQYSSLVVNSSWEDDLNTTETDSFAAASGGIKGSSAKDPLAQESLPEFEKQNNFFPGHLLPSEVCLLFAMTCRHISLVCHYILSLTFSFMVEHLMI